MKSILNEQSGWYIVRINQSTKSTTFKGETRYFDHYYRVYNAQNIPIKYCKFQQIDRFSKAMGIAVQDLPIVDAIDTDMVK